MRLRRKRWSKMEVEHVGADIIRPLCRRPPHFAGAQCAPLQRSLRERYAGAGREKKALCRRHRAFHSIMGSNPSNNGSSKNSLKLIPSPSQSFWMVTIPGFLLFAFNML